MPPSWLRRMSSRQKAIQISFTFPRPVYLSLVLYIHEFKGLFVSSLTTIVAESIMYILKSAAHQVSHHERKKGRALHERETKHFRLIEAAAFAFFPLDIVFVALVFHSTVMSKIIYRNPWISKENSIKIEKQKHKIFSIFAGKKQTNTHLGYSILLITAL